MPEWSWYARSDLPSGQIVAALFGQRFSGRRCYQIDVIDFSSSRAQFAYNQVGLEGQAAVRALVNAAGALRTLAEGSTVNAQTRMPDTDLVEQLVGCSLTTAEILYRLPDYQRLLQSLIWQDYDYAAGSHICAIFLTTGKPISMVPFIASP